MNNCFRIDTSRLKHQTKPAFALLKWFVEVDQSRNTFASPSSAHTPELKVEFGWMVDGWVEEQQPT